MIFESQNYTSVKLHKALKPRIKNDLIVPGHHRMKSTPTSVSRFILSNNYEGRDIKFQRSYPMRHEFIGQLLSY